MVKIFILLGLPETKQGLRCPAEDDGPVVSLLRPRIHSTVSGLHARCPGVRGIGALESVSTSGHHHFRACLNPERYPFQPFRIPQSLAALPSGSIVARFRPSSWIVTIIFCFTIMYPVFFFKKKSPAMRICLLQCVMLLC